jgi:hypothetical protein
MCSNNLYQNYLSGLFEMQSLHEELRQKIRIMYIMSNK